jgi:hypothetical protein
MSAGSSASWERNRLITASLLKPIGPRATARNTSAIPPLPRVAKSWNLPNEVGPGPACSRSGFSASATPCSLPARIALETYGGRNDGSRNAKRYGPGITQRSRCHPDERSDEGSRSAKKPLPAPPKTAREWHGTWDMTTVGVGDAPGFLAFGF